MPECQYEIDAMPNLNLESGDFVTVRVEDVTVMPARFDETTLTAPSLTLIGCGVVRGSPVGTKKVTCMLPRVL